MNFWKAFAVALVGSVVANVVIVLVIGPLVNTGSKSLMALTVPPVVVFTAIGAIGATAVYACMRAFLTKPKKPFIAVAAVVLLVSFIPDYMIIGQTTGPFAGGTVPEALTLMFMHLVAAVIITDALIKIWGSRG